MTCMFPLVFLFIASYLGISTAQETKNNRPRWTGDVRCFCNLPTCVATGYMCKSEAGSCFSDLGDYPDVFKARHGCLELLDRVRQKLCQQPGSGHIHQLWCCHKDMCNHIDSPEIRLRFNDTLTGSTLNSSEGARLFFNGAQQTPTNYNNNETWFKAATIAVPICGALILFVLIALAVKILKKDSLEQGFIHGSKHGGSIFAPQSTHPLVLPSSRKLNHYDNSGDLSSKKVPLLSQHNSETAVPPSQCVMMMQPQETVSKNSLGVSQCEKNEANAVLNLSAARSALVSQQVQPQSHSKDYALLVDQSQESVNISSMGLLHKQNTNNNSTNNLYRNVNLVLGGPPHNVSPPPKGKLYDKQQLSSVVTWGGAAGSPSHV